MAVHKTAPKGAHVLDLGAARAARAEARKGDGSPKSLVKLSAGYVEVQPEVDVTLLDDLVHGEVKLALSKLLADPADVDVVLADGVSAQDLQEIIGFVTGTESGEF